MASKAISEKRPWYSESIGCHPSDVGAHNQALRNMGVRNAHIEPDGRAVAHSEKGRNALMKAYGRMDKDAGYGQHSGS